jgi:ABC-type amino acid transport substrate-binding protein
MKQLLLALGLISCSSAFSAPSAPSAIEGEAGKVLKVATRDVPPFAVKQPDGSWSGITVEIWDAVSAELGWQSEFVDMGLGAMLDAVAQGEVDAVAGALTITAQREVVMDFSHPFLSSGLAIAVPRDAGGGWLNVVRRLFSEQFLNVVAGLGALLLAVGVLVWLMERRRNDQFGGSPLSGVGSGVWWSAVTMTTVGYGDKVPKTVGGRVVAVVWMFASVVVISSFTAAIATALTIGELGGKVRDKDDLGRVRVVTVEGSTSAAFLDARGDDVRTTDDLVQALRILAEGRADAVVYDEPILRYQVEQTFEDSLKVLPGSFERQDYGVAMPSGSPLREPFNRALLRLLYEPDWRSRLAGYAGGR